jgi:hypothetical protein
MSEQEAIIFAIRTLAGDTGLYLRERVKALSEIQQEAARQLEWIKAVNGGSCLEFETDSERRKSC